MIQDINKKIKALVQGFKVCKRLGEHSPIRLRRYAGALSLLRTWNQKRKLAETKIKKYERLCKRYEKLINR